MKLRKLILADCSCLEDVSGIANLTELDYLDISRPPDRLRPKPSPVRMMGRDVVEKYQAKIRRHLR